MRNPKLEDRTLSAAGHSIFKKIRGFPMNSSLLHPSPKCAPCSIELPVSLGLKGSIFPRFVVVYTKYCNFKPSSWWDVVLMSINWSVTLDSRCSAWQYTCQNCHPKHVPLAYQKLQTRALADTSIVGVLLQSCHSECWCHNVDMAEEVLYYE